MLGLIAVVIHPSAVTRGGGAASLNVVVPEARTHAPRAERVPADAVNPRLSALERHG